MLSPVAQFLTGTLPGVAADPEPSDCMVWKVVHNDPPQFAGLSAAIQVIAERRQSAKLTQRIAQEHTVKRAHRPADDDRFADCLTEACAFSWADLRGMGPQFDFGHGKPDIHVPPDLWIEAKSIYPSQASEALTVRLRLGDVLSGSVLAPSEVTRAAAFRSALENAKTKFARLESGRGVVFFNLIDVDVSQWANRAELLASYSAWLGQVERADPSVPIVLIRNFNWREPIRDPFADHGV